MHSLAFLLTRICFMHIVVSVFAVCSVQLTSFLVQDRAVPSTAMELKQVEEVHNLMELYIWLANQFEEQFVDAPIVREMVVKSNDLITLGLNALTRGSSPMANQKVEREGVRSEYPNPPPLRRTLPAMLQTANSLSWLNLHRGQDGEIKEK